MKKYLNKNYILYICIFFLNFIVYNDIYTIKISNPQPNVSKTQSNIPTIEDILKEPLINTIKKNFKQITNEELKQLKVDVNDKNSLEKTLGIINLVNYKNSEEDRENIQIGNIKYRIVNAAIQGIFNEIFGEKKSLYQNTNTSFTIGQPHTAILKTNSSHSTMTHEEFLDFSNTNDEEKKIKLKVLQLITKGFQKSHFQYKNNDQMLKECNEYGIPNDSCSNNIMSVRESLDLKNVLEYFETISTLDLTNDINNKQFQLYIILVKKFFQTDDDILKLLIYAVNSSNNSFYKSIINIDSESEDFDDIYSYSDEQLKHFGLYSCCEEGKISDLPLDLSDNKNPEVKIEEKTIIKYQYHYKIGELIDNNIKISILLFISAPLLGIIIGIVIQKPKTEREIIKSEIIQDTIQPLNPNLQTPLIENIMQG